MILGDNLGLHSILGFSESFMANSPYRNCKSTKFKRHHKLVQIDDKLRNDTNYSSDILINNLTLTEIKKLCVFNEISSFHLTENYSIVIRKYDIGMMLKLTIYNLNYFTIDTLNEIIESFNYGPINVRNRPPLLSDTLKLGVIKMSTNEMLCFTKY